MIIKNVKVFTDNDGEGCYAIPGLIDLHFHGCKGDDFCDGTKEANARIAEYKKDNSNVVSQRVQ